MFKTIQISKAIWRGVCSCSPFNCAASNVFIVGPLYSCEIIIRSWL